jgi:hypothetical protein
VPNVYSGGFANAAGLKYGRSIGPSVVVFCPTLLFVGMIPKTTPSPSVSARVPRQFGIQDLISAAFAPASQPHFGYRFGYRHQFALISEDYAKLQVEMGLAGSPLTLIFLYLS